MFYATRGVDFVAELKQRAAALKRPRARSPLHYGTRGMPKPLHDDLYPLLACVCAPTNPLRKDGDALICAACSLRHPIVDGVPVILHPEKSVFDAAKVIRDYREPAHDRLERLARSLLRFVPSIGSNLAAKDASAVMDEMLRGIAAPRVLVVGGGEVGQGLERFLNDPRYVIVESDVYFGSRCSIIADGHDLPFAADSFDAVICQAVLEHVARPHACIAEMHRVLKPGGVVFIDVPFLFPVHMGAHDFTRFTLGGLRAACRWFDERAAGVSGGPGQALAWMILYYWRALSKARLWTAFVMFVVPWFVFWLHHVDKLLVKRPQASDVASGLFFLGSKSSRPLSDRDVLERYWARRLPATGSAPSGVAASI
jgi:SAM-dependent methyltransferase/uncharacterized protein YbaR (Trm112 family)